MHSDMEHSRAPLSLKPPYCGLSCLLDGSRLLGNHSANVRALTYGGDWVQALTDEDLPALTSLVCLRELSLHGADDLGGEGLAALTSLLHLQVKP